MKKLLFVIILLMAMFTSKAQTVSALDSTDNFCFGAEQWISQYENWSRPRIFDFENDGDKDFAIIESNYDSLAVYINNGTADFTVTPALRIPTPAGVNLVDLAISDFDSDGFIDVVTIADNGDLYFYKNVSGTGLSPAGNLANTILLTLNAHKIEVHDLNNDGLADIIGSGMDYATNTFYAFTYQQSVTFSFFQMTLIPVFAGHTAQWNMPPTHFAFADFDADGFQDFVIGSEDLSDTIEVYQNAGTTAAIGFLPIPTTFTNAATGFTRYILARDCNGDGMTDIAIESSGGFTINKNLAAGMTFTPTTIDLSIFCSQFDFADMNSDNMKDLITSNYGNYNIYKGTSASQIQFWSGYYNNFNLFDRRQFALADFDGNSTQDFLFIGTGDAPFLQVSRNFSFYLKNTITSTNTLICGSTPVQFSVTSTEPSYPGNYSWTPPPGSGTAYTATTSGSVSCTFTYTLPPNLGTCILYTDTIYVNSQTPPTAIINTSATGSVCAGTAVTLNATVLPTTTTYTWSTGSSTPAIVVSPTTTTTYSLFMDDGCLSTGTFTVDIYAKPIVNITAPTTTMCAGDSLVLTANGANNYTWTPSSANSTTFTVKPTSTSVYTLVGENTFGCSDTTSTTITVNIPPAVSITPSKTLICYPDTVTLNAGGATSYTWSTGSNASSISIIAFTNTTYTVAGSNGCKATSVFSVSGFPRPVITATSSKLTVCNGDSITLKAYGAASYSWAPVFFIGNSFYTYPIANTTYSVLGQASNGCYNYTTVSVAISSPPVLDIQASELCIGKNAIITAVGATSYTWNTGSTNPYISQTPANSSPLSFTVDGVDASGCRSTVSKTFNISDQCKLIIWNGVTPNGDGLNDFFFLENIEQYPGNKVNIYNRWGQLLAHIEDYDNKNRLWNGTSNDPEAVNVPSGTYYYVIDLGNGSDKLKGYIELTKKDLN